MTAHPRHDIHKAHVAQTGALWTVLVPSATAPHGFIVHGEHLTKGKAEADLADYMRRETTAAYDAQREECLKLACQVRDMLDQVPTSPDSLDVLDMRDCKLALKIATQYLGRKAATASRAAK